MQFGIPTFIMGGGRLKDTSKVGTIRFVSKDQNNAFAIIPGIAMDETW